MRIPSIPGRSEWIDGGVFCGKLSVRTFSVRAEENDRITGPGLHHPERKPPRA